MYERAVEKSEDQAKKSYLCLYLTVAVLNVIMMIVYAFVMRMATQDGAKDVPPNPSIVESEMLQPQIQAMSLLDETI